MLGERGDTERATAKQVLAFAIDQSLRLLHPTIPFITERLWTQLNRVAPNRGLPGVAELNTNVQLIRAAFPPDEGYPAFDDPAIVAAFGTLQDATRGVRELRSQHGVSPKDKVKVTVAPASGGVGAFAAHSHVVKHMGGIAELTVEPQAKRPKNAASIAVHGVRIYVHDISDDEAERQRTTQALTQLEKQITSGEAKLGNEKFLANAKPEIVEAERQRLSDMLTQRTALQEHLAELQG